MVLKTIASHPSTRSYVLKLHCDASPQHGRVAGWLENISTGRRFDFDSADKLLACLALDAMASPAEATDDIPAADQAPVANNKEPP